MAYVKGDVAHFHIEISDPHTGDLVDPATVRFKFETPANVETMLVYLTDAALTRESLGKYQAVVTLNATGTWGFRWETTGNYAVADEFTRYVNASQFA